MNKFKIIQIIYGVLSVGMFCSMFTGSYKISGIAMLLWVTYTLWMVYSVMLKKNNFTLRDLSNQVDKNITTSWKNKKYGQITLYLSVIPMMAIGLITVVLLLFCMIFLL
jgi:fatty-acid desaturase